MLLIDYGEQNNVYWWSANISELDKWYFVWIRYRKMQGSVIMMPIILTLNVPTTYFYSLQDNYAMRRLKELLLSQVVMRTLYDIAVGLLGQVVS